MAKKTYNAVGDAELAHGNEEVLAEMSDDTPGTSLAVRPTMAVGEQGGYQEPQSIKLPRLQLIYGTSKVVGFAPGDFVLAKEHRLVGVNEPPRPENELEVVIISTFGYLKQYIEPEMRKEILKSTGKEPEAKRYMNLEGKFADAREEALAAGEVVDWPSWGTNGPRPTVKPATDLQLLIKKPKDLLCGLFGVTLAGEEFAPADWSIDKSANESVFGKKSSFSTTKFSWKQKGLPFTRWKLSSKMVVADNVYPVPILKFAGFSTPEFVAELKQFLGAEG